MKLMRLQHNNISLRPLEPEDLSVFYNLENDMGLWETSNTTVPYSKFALRNYIESTQGDVFVDKEVRLVIERISDKEVLGMVDLYNYSPLNQRAEIGIVVFESYQNKGYATDALKVLCRYAFDFLMIHQLYAYVKVDNLASKLLFEGVGFSSMAVLTDWYVAADGFCDALIYQKKRLVVGRI